jgi:hypothetical protein
VPVIGSDFEEDRCCSVLLDETDSILTLYLHLYQNRAFHHTQQLLTHPLLSQSSVILCKGKMDVDADNKRHQKEEEARRARRKVRFIVIHPL